MLFCTIVIIIIIIILKKNATISCFLDFRFPPPQSSRSPLPKLKESSDRDGLAPKKGSRVALWSTYLVRSADIWTSNPHICIHTQLKQHVDKQIISRLSWVQNKQSHRRSANVFTGRWLSWTAPKQWTFRISSFTSAANWTRFLQVFTMLLKTMTIAGFYWTLECFQTNWLICTHKPPDENYNR